MPTPLGCFEFWYKGYTTFRNDFKYYCSSTSTRYSTVVSEVYLVLYLAVNDFKYCTTAVQVYQVLHCRCIQKPVVPGTVLVLVGLWLSHR